MKKQKKKIREEIIECIIDSKDTVIEFEYDFLSESISFKNCTISNAKTETTYKKNSGKLKRTNSTPLASSNLSFNVDKALNENFDLLIAIDTNTKKIDGKTVSVTMSYYVEKPLSYYTDSIPFLSGASYLFINLVKGINAEKLGWHTIVSNNVNLKVLDKYRIGLIVDCDLGMHQSINNRETPYFEDNYLPENMQLIYASSDSTSDSLQNIMISYCDKFANKIMRSDELIKHISTNKCFKDSKYCDGFTPISYQREECR